MPLILKGFFGRKIGLDDESITLEGRSHEDGLTDSEKIR